MINVYHEHTLISYVQEETLLRWVFKEDLVSKDTVWFPQNKLTCLVSVANLWVDFTKDVVEKKKQEIFMNGGEPTKQGGGQFLSTDVNGDLQNRGKILKIK